jgi:hypothetical protein
MEFNDIVLIICAILALFLVFKEVRRNSKVNLTWRILASLLMVISFALLIVPINYQTIKKQTTEELTIITEGTDADTIANIKGDKYDLDSSQFLSQKSLKIKHIEDLAYYLKEHNDIKKVNIYGYGLDEQQLKKLEGYHVTFHPASLPQGIISASWQTKIRATEDLKIEGIYNNTSNAAIKLKLYGLGTDLDSTVVNAKSKANFSFNNQPKQAGKATYQLIALNGRDTLSVEKMPFEVIAKQPIQVLILASFPDFEYKFLKNWLYEKQYQVIFRSQISQGKFSSDFLNTPATNVNRINAALLKKIDVLVIDENELSAISSGERSAINEAVNNGMGLILRLINAKPNANSPKYGRYEIPSATATALNISAVNEDLKFNELPFPQTLFLETSLNEQVLFKSATGKSVVNMQLNGMGKVLISSLAATYQWELAGKKTDYAAFWSAMFLKAAKKEVKNQSIELFPQFINVGNRARVIASLSDAKVPSLSFNDIKLNPKQNMELPFKWDAVFWPTNAGWNALTVNNVSTNSFIYEEGDWAVLKNTEKLRLNANFSNRQLNQKVDLKVTEQKVTEEFSKWWFYLVFIIAAAYLWYEQRFLAN